MNCGSLSACDGEVRSFLIVQKATMNGSANKRLFWWAIIAQVVGAQVFFWDALPDYRELTEGAVVVGYA
jgi:hypothetical protein